MASDMAGVIVPVELLLSGSIYFILFLKKPNGFVLRNSFCSELCLLRKQKIAL